MVMSRCVWVAADDFENGEVENVVREISLGMLPVWNLKPKIPNHEIQKLRTKDGAVGGDVIWLFRLGVNPTSLDERLQRDGFDGSARCSPGYPSQICKSLRG